MKTIFLADAHLKSPSDPASERLIRFFDLLQAGGDTGRAVPSGPIMTEHLVIAGDFFDFWFARGDAIYPGFRRMVDRLAGLRRAGIRITYCEGNHDFLLEDYFSKRLGFVVYPAWGDFMLDGQRVLVSHGDTVDRGNRTYLALRRFLRSAPARRLQQMLPLPFLWRLARFSATLSKEMSDQAADRMAEIMHRFAREKFREGYDAVVLGHCHKPLLRQEEINGRLKTFATLGDWITHDSYLRCDTGRFTLERFLPA